MQTAPPLAAHARARWAAAAALGLALLLALGCTGGGSKSKGRQVLLDTDFDDARLGAEAAEGMAAEMGLIEEPALSAYVEAIGRRMVPFAPRRPFEYAFFIVDQPAPNAFALPGGYIYVSRGLLALTNSEDELACVIGHEITHAAERHTAGRQQYSQRLNPLSIGYMRMAQIAAYGRDQERDADRGGQILASQAGWDPMGMARFLQDMSAMERNMLGMSRMPSFFDSHPPTPERAATAANRAEHLTWQPRQHIAPTRAEFLAKLEGLVVGHNPAEGIFEGQRFLHRDMDFSVRFPDGWQLVNTREAVGAIEPTGQAFVALRFAGPGDDPQAAARLFVETELRQARGNVRHEQPIQVGEYPAYRLEVEAGAVKTGGHLTFIAYEGVIFRIDTIARAAEVAKFDGRGRAVVRSFRPLTDEEKGSFEITRLHIVVADAGETLAELSLRTSNALPLGTTAVLNDLFIDSKLEAGQLVKIGLSRPYVPPTQAPRPRALEDRPPDA
jgi:predicted Zn-dependent protease